MPRKGKFHDPVLFQKQLLNFQISNKSKEEVTLGERGKGVDGASKVECAEQVTTNICAIIFFNCELCHELAWTVSIIERESSQSKHQPTLAGKVSHRVVVVYFKKGGFGMPRSRNAAEKSAGKWISRFKVNWPQCGWYQAGWLCIWLGKRKTLIHCCWGSWQSPHPDKINSPGGRRWPGKLQNSLGAHRVTLRGDWRPLTREAIYERERAWPRAEGQGRQAKLSEETGEWADTWPLIC